MDGALLECRTIWCATAVMALLAVAAGVAFPIPTHDTAMRYAMMAEKFAACEWHEAFHPRFGVLFPFLAGMFNSIFGCGGLSACSGVSMFAWAVSVVPAFYLAKAVFGSKVGWFAVVCYIACPLPLLWALQGLREPYRLLGVVLMTAGLFEASTMHRRSLWLTCIGFCILLLLRADTIVFAVMFALAYAVVDRFGRRTWVLAGMGATVIQIPCWHVWSWTGWWLPAPQYIGVFQKIVG